MQLNIQTATRHRSSGPQSSATSKVRGIRQANGRQTEFRRRCDADAFVAFIAVPQQDQAGGPVRAPGLLREGRRGKCSAFEPRLYLDEQPECPRPERY